MKKLLTIFTLLGFLGGGTAVLGIDFYTGGENEYFFKGNCDSAKTAKESHVKVTCRGEASVGIKDEDNFYCHFSADGTSSGDACTFLTPQKTEKGVNLK